MLIVLEWSLYSESDKSALLEGAFQYSDVRLKFD